MKLLPKVQIKRAAFGEQLFDNELEFEMRLEVAYLPLSQ
jgi:hypothetical protein